VLAARIHRSQKIAVVLAARIHRSQKIASGLTANPVRKKRIQFNFKKVSVEFAPLPTSLALPISVNPPLGKATYWY
jgi:hypothetical protein